MFFGQIKNIHPHNFANGGMVKHHMINIPRFILKPGDDDRVFARVMPGEIVIPLPHVKKVEKFLKQEHIKLPGL